MVRQVDPVLYLVQRSNQRGGRMLSVIDLLEAGTLDRTQLCWLLERIETGCSWLVGARPGGAGKTTIMSALVAMLPVAETVRLANPDSGWEQSKPGDCVIAYEISRGHYDGYIWGRELRTMAELGLAGCRVVSNLHADTLAEAQLQIVGRNGVAAAGFLAFETFLSITIGGSLRARPIVRSIHYVAQSAWLAFAAREHTPTTREEAIGDFLDTCVTAGLRSVPDVREAWLAWGARQTGME